MTEDESKRLATMLLDTRRMEFVIAAAIASCLNRRALETNAHYLASGGALELAREVMHALASVASGTISTID